MKIAATVSIAVLLLLAHTAAAATSTLPDLYKISQHKFSALYDPGNYNESALFLTEYNKERGAPDLLYYGTTSRCNFESATAGVDMAFFTMIGPNVDLEDLSAQTVLQDGDEWRYNTVPVYEGATYGLVESKSDTRSVVVFNVTSAGRCGSPVGIDYSVLFFDHIEEDSSSPGFDWNKRPSA
eukprot:TRINITY_DN116_c0_g1_i1.p1 TRINITY_DN116_c0_g1~~TRINITY_DN116_c0_g1_i1.p1  ORF type:complete len:182 (+),score=74.25 TRINITY_DN116_c0_g1_i1:27-572(+)